MDEMWAAALVACLGTFVVNVSVIASSLSASAAVVPSPTIESAGGGGEYEGASISDEHNGACSIFYVRTRQYVIFMVRRFVFV